MIIASSVNINNIGLFRTIIFVFMGIVLLVIGGSTILLVENLKKRLIVQIYMLIRQA